MEAKVDTATNYKNQSSNKLVRRPMTAYSLIFCKLLAVRHSMHVSVLFRRIIYARMAVKD